MVKWFGPVHAYPPPINQEPDASIRSVNRFDQAESGPVKGMSTERASSSIVQQRPVVDADDDDDDDHVARGSLAVTNQHHNHDDKGCSSASFSPSHFDGTSLTALSVNSSSTSTSPAPASPSPQQQQQHHHHHYHYQSLSPSSLAVVRTQNNLPSTAVCLAPLPSTSMPVRSDNNNNNNNSNQMEHHRDHKEIVPQFWDGSGDRIEWNQTKQQPTGLEVRNKSSAAMVSSAVVDVHQPTMAPPHSSSIWCQDNRSPSPRQIEPNRGTALPGVAIGNPSIVPWPIHEGEPHDCNIASDAPSPWIKGLATFPRQDQSGAAPGNGGSGATHQHAIDAESLLNQAEYFEFAEGDETTVDSDGRAMSMASTVDDHTTKDSRLDTPPATLSVAAGHLPPETELLLPPAQAQASTTPGNALLDASVAQSLKLVIVNPSLALFPPASGMIDQNASSSSSHATATSSAAASTVSNASSRIARTSGHRPVLYSAIGSLEDFSGSNASWRHRIHGLRPQRYEFPSVASSDATKLLPPGGAATAHFFRTGNNRSQSNNKQVISIEGNYKNRIEKTPQLRGEPMAADVSQQDPNSCCSARRPEPSSLSATLSAFEKQSSPPTASDEDATMKLSSAQGDLHVGDGQYGCASIVCGDQGKDAGTQTADAVVTKTDPNTRPASTQLPSKSNSSSFHEDATQKKQKNKSVTIAPASDSRQQHPVRRTGKKKGHTPHSKKGPKELFRPSSDAYTPRMGKKVIKYKPAEMRTPVQQMASPLGTLSRPNFRDALRRVAMIIHQHIVKIERRFESKQSLLHDDGLFLDSMKEEFSEDRFVTPKYRCTMVRVPMARPGMVYGLKRLRPQYDVPTEAEIYEFAHRLFKSVQLSSECSIVCLIYVERLMEQAKVPVLASTWRPIFMCGLLLASKVWQDLSSWNIEFAVVYPQFSLQAINRLELLFLRRVRWDLYISSSLYAKYYFALRSLVEKTDFRERYNRMVGGVNYVQAEQALKIEKRSTQVKQEALSQLSRSM